MPKRLKITGSPTRIKNTEGFKRYFELLNKKEFCRRLEHTNYQTLQSRVKNETNLTETVEQKASAQEMTELLDEMFYEIGVMIGRIVPEPHKKYKYLDVTDISERDTDDLKIS